MRRVLALAAVTTAVFAVAACTGDPAPLASTAPTVSLSATAAPTVPVPPPVTPGDAAVTHQVCVDASAAATEVTTYFSDQIAALEAAAAKGDQTAMVAAATAIQQKFLSLATALGTLAQKPVDSDVKSALADAAAALKEISSEAYTGTTQDTQKRLVDLAATFAKACG